MLGGSGLASQAQVPNPIVALVLMGMYILSGKEGKPLHTRWENGGCGVAHCLGLFMARAMSDVQDGHGAPVLCPASSLSIS